MPNSSLSFSLLSVLYNNYIDYIDSLEISEGAYLSDSRFSSNRITKCFPPSVNDFSTKLLPLFPGSKNILLNINYSTVPRARYVLLSVSLFLTICLSIFSSKVPLKSNKLPSHYLLSSTLLSISD